MTEINLTKCELAYELTYNPIYRAAQFWSFFVSLLAMPSLIYLIYKRILSLPFHGNLKFLLISYFIGTISFATVSCLNFGYQFFVPFIVSSKCSLIIDQSLFKYGHLSALVTMTIPMMLPVGFTIERFVALKMAHSYETSRLLLGPVLFISLASNCFSFSILSIPFQVSLNIVILISIYHDDPFTDNFISFILIPSNSARKFNMFFWFLIVVKFTNFACNCILLVVHNRMHKKHRKHSSSLSAKYEMEEISQSSQFTLIVTFTHLFFFGWYVTSILFTRTVGQDFFGGYINYTVMRGVFCATPTYNLVIVFIGFKALQHLNSKRNNKISTTVQIKSTGHEGAKNYDDAIANYWDSVYIRMNK
ncbi:CRE-SRB-12 protein [Caenorhabditis remanei]|uniref:CRE-SRB-12 protein n=1 Tax=Caenorhabditis remanei TaxID=31234 RepID=E3M4G0_CAERE|nr:CRE-SRB-12 protein [Caenorhabditis remanei]